MYKIPLQSVFLSFLSSFKFQILVYTLFLNMIQYLFKLYFKQILNSNKITCHKQEPFYLKRLFIYGLILQRLTSKSNCFTLVNKSLSYKLDKIKVLPQRSTRVLSIRTFEFYINTFNQQNYDGNIAVVNNHAATIYAVKLHQVILDLKIISFI